jgi:hypothetical protein
MIPVVLLGTNMRRREFLGVLSWATVAWPSVAHPQAERMRRIGVLMHVSQNDPDGEARLTAFVEGLKASRGPMRRAKRTGSLVASPLVAGGPMKWRAFIMLIGGLAIAWPLASYAQQPKQPLKRVGLLALLGCPLPPDTPIARRLAELGWVDGRNFVFDCVSTVGRLDQVPALARELVMLRTS